MPIQFNFLNRLSPRHVLHSTLVVLSFFIVTGVVLYAYQQVSAFPGSGDGNSESPYIIDTCEKLEAVDSDLGAHYRLDTSLTCTTQNFPLARVMDGGNLNAGFEEFGGFSGVLDGNGNTINYTKNIPDGVDVDNFLGLFGYVNGGTIRDLVVQEGSDTLIGFSDVGLLAGKANNALFINITSASNVDASSNVGGLVGSMMNSRIVGAHFFGNVAGISQTGGLVGSIYGNYLGTEGLPAIEQSFIGGASSVITEFAGNTGGLVGYIANGTIKNSYSNATIQGDANVGGLAGLGSGARIINSYASGDVSGINSVGGLMGVSFNSATNIEFSFSAATVTGTSYVGAIVGGLTDFVMGDNITMLTATGTYFDLTQQDGVTDCSGMGTSTFSDGCLPLSPIDPSTYWKSPGGVPMNVWDQVDVWNMDSMTNYPTLFNYVEPTDFAGGDGSLGTPYIIETCAQLQNIQDYTTSHFRLNGPGGIIDCSATAGWNGNSDEWVDGIVEGVGGVIPDTYDGVANNGYFGFNPIGDSGSPFVGTLDGNGNTISGLWIFRKNESDVGLFSAIGSSAQIYNLTLSESDIVGGANTGGIAGQMVGDTGSIDNVHTSDVMVRAYLSIYGGGLVGYMDVADGGAITSSTVSSGTVHGSGNVIGGLVGYLREGIITNATSSAAVDGGEYIGGAIGHMVGGTVTNVHVSGDVESNFSENVYLFNITKWSEYTGGFVGRIEGGLITQSSASGDVTFQGNYGGGFVGSLDGGAITHATSTGNVTPGVRISDNNYPNYVGGFAGNIQNNIFNYGVPDELGTVLTHLHASSTVYAPSSTYVGGFAGYIVNRSMASSTAVGTVTGEQYVGGFGGQTGCYNEFRDSSAAVDVVSANGYAGGFSGSDECGGERGSEFIRVSATGDVVSGLGASTGVGGLIGFINRASVLDSFATGNVTSTGSEVGGLIGSAAYAVSVDTSYATGDVSGELYNVGGLIGQIIGQDGELATVTNVYARGDVTTLSGQGGGLIGYMDQYVTVSNAYATGNITNGYGLIGLNASGNVVDSFWDTQTSGTGSGCGGWCDSVIGRSTLQMNTQSTFDEASWDLETIWGINETDNNGYPFFQIQGYGYEYVAPVQISGGDGTLALPFIAVNCFEAADPGYYVLGDDLSTTGDCITITTSSVYIDGAGFSISGDDGDHGVIAVNGGPFSDIRVHNLTVVDFNYGMRFDTLSDSIIEDNIVTSTRDFGVFLEESSDITITSNTFSTDMSYGVYLDDFTTSTLVSTNTFSNVGTAVRVEDYSEDNIISYNTITDGEYGVYVDYESHGCYIGYNDITDVTYGFFIDETDNCIVEYNTITLSQYNFGEGSSSPLVYTWNGEEYQYVADVGNPLFRFLNGVDNVSLPEGSIVPQGNKYSVKISQEYNEIVYYDELALTTVDHPVGYDAVVPLRRGQESNYTTISDTPSHSVVSCTDMYGNDCVNELQASDDSWSYKDESNRNSWIMNFGDLSGEERIMLVLEGTRDYSLTAPGGSLRTLQVKDENGNWVNVFDPATIAGFRGAPRRQVIDLTGKFKSNDYSVKFGFDRTSLSYAAIDTSTVQPITTNTVHPSTVDLQFRGYTAIDKNNFWDHDYETVFDTPQERFGPQVGMFTKYGEVSPLLEEADDQFVIMRHGDHMSIEFPYTAPADGLERTVVVNNVALFKHADMAGGVGLTVEPLPFRGMTAYPPVAPQTYPMTEENKAYLETWNTRDIRAGGATAFPYSVNTIVRYNTINSLIESMNPYAGDYGLHMYYETSSTVHHNTISGFDYGIYIEDSEYIDVHHNTISDIGEDGIYVYDTDYIDIAYNTITNIGDDGMDLDGLSDVEVRGNTVDGAEDSGIYLSSSWEYTVIGNTVNSTSSSLRIKGEYSSEERPYDAYSGDYAWFSNYITNQQTSIQRTLDLTGVEIGSTVELYYQMWYAMTWWDDAVYTEVSTDGGENWIQVGSSYSGNYTSWDYYQFDLSGYIGQEILVRMRFYTDGEGTSYGVYIDDVRLTVNGNEVFTDTFESGPGSWEVVTDPDDASWELINMAPTEDVTKDVFDNTFTSSDIGSTVVRLENVDDIVLTGNTLRGSKWVYSNGDNAFNDEDSGNTYLFADGSGAWTVYDITDSNGDGWADGGNDRPFSSSTLTNVLWEGDVQDEYPATEKEPVVVRRSGGVRFVPTAKPKQSTTPASVSGTGAATIENTPSPVVPSVPSQPDIAIPVNGLQCTTNLVLTTPVRFGLNNNANDVKLLEQFLNTYEGTNLLVNGIYETADFNAVVKWQEKHAVDILTPWGLNKGTGYVFTTSLKKIKEIHEKNCATAATSTQPTTVVSASCLNTQTTLTSGMNGPLITTAQTLLKKINFFTATPTGFYGPVTTASVRAFQSANGIESVGYIGPATRAKLNELGCR